MPKVIHSLQLHISHQMRSYSCQDHLTIELYLFFWVVGHQGNLGEKGPNTPKSSTESHKKKSKVFNSLFHFKRDLMLASRLSMGRIIPVSQVLRYWGNLWKLNPNTPNHVLGRMKSNPKSSAPCFRSSETLLQCQGPLRVELYLFHRYTGIGVIWENWVQIPQITCRDT